MAWIDVGTDEPQWVPDNAPGMETVREGVSQFQPGFSAPKGPEYWPGPSGLFALLGPKYQQYEDEISQLQGYLNQYGKEGPQSQEALRRLNELNLLYWDTVDPNRGLDNDFVSRTLGTPYAPLALAGAGALGLLGGGAATFGGEAAAGTLAGSAPYIGAGGSAAAGATPALLGETALAPYIGGAAAAGTALPAGAELAGAGGTAAEIGTPAWDAAQGFGAVAEPSEALWNLPAGGVAGGAGGVAAAGAGVAAAGSPLSRIIDGTATNADWAQVLGTVGATGLGVYGSMREGDRLSNLQQQMRADRAPYLAAGTNYLDPQKWIEGPGQAFTKGTLQQLSATHGNPISSPTALGIATDASMRNWLGGVNTLGSLGLGGQGIQAQLGSQAAGAYGDIYGNIAGGISDLVNPRMSLADLMRTYRGVIA